MQKSNNISNHILQASGIELSTTQTKRVEQLISSGKMDLFMVKRLLPGIPKHLIDKSLDVMNEIEINL